MSSIDDYISSVTPPQRAEFLRIREVVKATVPSVEEGTSYGMAAYLYKKKAFLSAIANKKFLSLYPFSGKVIEKLRDQLIGYECTSGSIHFSIENTLPDSLLKEIILARIEEIDGAGT